MATLRVVTTRYLPAKTYQIHPLKGGGKGQNGLRRSTDGKLNAKQIHVAELQRTNASKQLAL